MPLLSIPRADDLLALTLEFVNLVLDQSQASPRLVRSQAEKQSASRSRRATANQPIAARFLRFDETLGRPPLARANSCYHDFVGLVCSHRSLASEVSRPAQSASIASV